MKKILVIGSLNMDTVIETPYMPQSGETLAGKSIALVPGGKGANQAYTVGKLGGDVSIIGAVADDSIGTALKANLESAGVNISGISTLPGTTTGQAFITVDDNGANSIILIAGANGLVSREMIDQHRSLVQACDIVMMQLEIDWNVVAYAKDLAVSMCHSFNNEVAPTREHNLALEIVPDTGHISPGLAGDDLRNGQLALHGVAVLCCGTGCIRFIRHNIALCVFRQKRVQRLLPLHVKGQPTIDCPFMYRQLLQGAVQIVHHLLLRLGKALAVPQLGVDLVAIATLVL